MLSTVIYDLDCGIPAKYSKRQTSFYSMQVSFRFHSLRRSEILASPSICTKIRTWRFHRTEEVLIFPSNPKSLHRLNSSIFKKKSLCGQIPSTSGVLRVARCGSGAKAPPLAARPVDTSPISRWPSRPICDKIPTAILQSWFVTNPSGDVRSQEKVGNPKKISGNSGPTPVVRGWLRG